MFAPKSWLSFLPHRLFYKVLAIATTLLILLSHRGMATAATNGSFRVIHGPIASADYAEIRQAIKSERLYEDIAKGLNETFKLPTDMTIMLSACGTENAFYDPSKKQLVMCDELLGHFIQIFAQESQSADEIAESAIFANLFVFFHELGHGLIDVFDLPIVGREEDAVDDFSALLLLEAGEEGEKAVFAGADWFRLQNQANDSNELAFWDEHSLDPQRFYNIACLVYGKDPQKYSGIVSNGILPESRAARCEAEYQKKSRSWEQLLAPYAKAG
jgi:hypothetical protein